MLVYRGVEDGGKVAIFELTGEVDAQGDGECVPTPEDCQYLKLRAGETEFITVTGTGEETDAQYQLDLVKIYKKDDGEGDRRGTSRGSRWPRPRPCRLDGQRDRYVFDSRPARCRRSKYPGHARSNPRGGSR